MIKEEEGEDQKKLKEERNFKKKEMKRKELGSEDFFFLIAKWKNP